jgi:hypothetical protein
MPSNRLRTRYEPVSNQVLLQIEDVRPEDVGQYLVIASNPAGKDSTGGTLKIIPDKGGDEDRASVPSSKRPRGQERRPLEVAPSPKQLKKVSQEMRPPRVLVPLSDSDVEESMPVILTTKIDAGEPKASVRIFHCKLNCE